MAITITDAGKNYRLDALLNSAEVGQVPAGHLGSTPQLRIYSGAPTGANAAAPAGLLATLTLPTTAFAAAASGAKAKTGTWSGTASAAGTAASFRLVKSDGTTTVLEGTVGQGAGDLSLDNTSIAGSQTITINTFSVTDGN